MGFQKAKREQVWLKVLLSGASGSGKSYSALKVATGIAKKCNSGIAYIGTEGSRNKYYANEFDYDLLELEEPFECEKYMNAIDEAVNAGYKVLIIDSMSHEWKWLNDVHDKMPGNSFTNWGKLKPRHHKFMDKILNSPIHVIATARGKDDWVLEDKNGKQIPKKVGMGQQQDKDISYEYTVSLMISQDTHVASADKDNTHLFDGRFEVLTEKDGERLYDWANQGEVPVPKAPQPTYSNVSVNNEEILKEVKKEIISLCTQLGGTKNAPLMEALKEYVPSGNPNALKDLSVAQECLTKIKDIQPVQA
jgi:hypothetical protein